MNYYERIDRSIAFVESHLTEDFTVEQAAQQACMSISNFYRMFLSIAGYSIKDYIRKRRLANAAAELISEKNALVIDTAVKYGYNSADGFSRSFKDEFGINPSEVKMLSKSKSTLCGLQRINIMDEYFSIKDKNLLEQYPDIKLLKKMPDMRVACFTYFGENPEEHAFGMMKSWAQKEGFHFNTKNDNGECAYRIFGYNNPDPSNPESNETYGYEVCVTIDEETYRTLQDAPPYGSKKSYDGVKRKTLAGGMFAVVSVKRTKDEDLGCAIMKSWQRFSKWMELSKFVWGGHQYLEEHLGFSDDDEHTGGVELYLPVAESDAKKTGLSPTEDFVAPCKVAFFRHEGTDFEKAACETWDVILSFAKKHNLNAETTRIFMYGSGFKKTPPFFHEIMLTVPDSFTTEDEQVKLKTFAGGTYMTVMTTQRDQGSMWVAMEQWRKETKTPPSRQQWFSEWFLTDLAFPSKAIKIFYPVG